MKKKQAVLAAAVLAGILITGCGQKSTAGAWEANENSIYVSSGLEVESALIYTSEKNNDLYTQDGLASFVKEKIAEYNTAQGAAAEAENKEGAEALPVALESCTLEGQKGKLVLDYKTPDDFVRFSQETGDNTHTVTALTVADIAAGLPEDLKFQTPDGKAADAAEVAKLSGGHVITVEGSATLYTEGKVAYVSEGVTMKRENAVLTTEGRNCIVFQ